MDNLLIILIILAVAFITGIFFYLMQQQLANLRKELGERLKENILTIQGETYQIGQRFDTAMKISGEIQKQLGSLEQANLRVLEIGRDIASLQDILRSPNLRGEMGELFLGNLLAQIMPKEYFNLEHTFKSGEKVDAAIKVGERLIPIDSKFPLESFKRYIQSQGEDLKLRCKKEFIKAVKDHIDSIASKYILPDEGTYEFALMYIPAENVYYETIVRDEDLDESKGIFEHALKRKVIPVSPNSFYAYLQVIILGLKGLSVEKSAQDILSKLLMIQNEFSKFKEDFDILGTHLTNSRSSFERASKRLERFNDKLSNIESSQNTQQLPQG